MGFRRLPPVPSSSYMHFYRGCGRRQLGSIVVGTILLACSGGEGLSPPPDGGGGSGGGVGTGGAPPGTGGDVNQGAGGGVPASGGAPSAGGAPSTGGSGGTVANGPCVAQPVSSQFTLNWEDNFDSWNSGRWTKMTHTFDINVAQFTEQQVVVEGGYLKLKLVNQPAGDRQYQGGEVRTGNDFLYGRFDTCVKWGRGSGVVASFFTYIYNEDNEHTWNEIDIEYLGGNNVGVQYNLIWRNAPQEGNQYDPHFDDLGLDAADDFHQYSMEWIPGEVRFFVDGELRHIENGASATEMTERTSLRMNLWAASNGFAGNFDPGAIPTESWYDWVRVYDYSP